MYCGPTMKKRISGSLEYFRMNTMYVLFVNHKYNPNIYDEYELTKKIINLGNMNITLIHPAKKGNKITEE